MDLMLIVGGLLPTLFVVGIPIYFVRRYLKMREREVKALEARQTGAPETRLLEEENKNLRDRVEKLEAIITSADHDLNRKLAALEVPSAQAGGGAVRAQVPELK